MKIKMKLLSDVIFGNGLSVPGAEDISVQRDSSGFPYYKGTTFKGLFREELERLFELKGEDNAAQKVDRLMGKADSNRSEGQLIFSDFMLSEEVKRQILDEMNGASAEDVLDVLTNLRTFTEVSSDGVASEGSLRIARCVDAGLIFYGEIDGVEDEELVSEVLSMIKWVGSMRNRGFGKVKISIEGV